MLRDFECPYCGEPQADDGESAETGVTYTQECDVCGKTFCFTVDYIKTYDTSEAPCQNGAEHSLKPMISSWHPPGFIRHRCVWCGEEVKVPTDEAAGLMKGEGK